MSAPRAVLAGASGFIGTRLSEDLQSRGYDVRLVGRLGPDVCWGDRAGLIEAVDGAEVLINLAGRSVGCRYHDNNRNVIYNSRLETTTELHQSVSAAAEPPPLRMNASTATIYRHALDRPQSEDDGEIGDGFSVDVARNWERTFFAGDLPGVRRVALRMAIVLGDGPALTKLATAARFGLGGPQLDGWWFPHRRYRGIGPDPSGPTVWRAHAVPADGPGSRPGDQKFSWIHLEDLIAVLHFIVDHPELDGPVNVAAPGQPPTGD